MTQQLNPDPQKSSLLPFDIQRDDSSIIKVIGVGGGGSNAVNHMYSMGIKGVDFLVCNTDQQALDTSSVPARIQLGPDLTGGRGAGSIPDVGKQAAIENIEEIRRALGGNTRMVFVTAGMGGGTGTGAAPIIAGIAREMGILTVGIVTIPFMFEGKKRRIQAEAGLEEMKRNVDALLIICNDKLREIYGNLNLRAAFGRADDVLSVAAKSIAEIITNTMHMNVDFADIQTVMKDSGVAIMGSASAEGDNRAVRAAEQALDSPLLNDNVILGARYILLNISSGINEVTMDEVGEINDFIQAQAGQTADIIMGIGHDESLGEKVGVTIIATGFKTGDEKNLEKVTPKAERIVHQLNDKPVVNAEPVAVVAPAAPVVPATPVNVVAETSAPAPAPAQPVDSMEPVLIIKPEVPSFSTPAPVLSFNKEEKESKSQQDAFEFELSMEISRETSISQPELIAPPVNEPVFKSVTTQEEKAPEVSPEEEMYRRSRERIMRLKEMNYRMNTPNGIADLEREPAYKRKNVTLENTPPSSESSVSRFTLSVDENNDRKPELRTNNPYLHDRVD